MSGHLYFGDNLDVLREEIADETVDLVYLDPPFNKDATFNVLFRSPAGRQADAQIEAFEDTWTWGEASAHAYDEVIRSGHAAAGLLRSVRSFLGDNAMMAYLSMMSVRLIELHRVLRPTGSLYLHCDPTASHYLKVLLDGVFGPENFQAEIIWRRTNSRSASGKWPRLHDVILHYSYSAKATFRTQKSLGDIAKTPHTLVTWKDGLKYNTFELTGAGVTKNGESGKSWRGFDPNAMGRHWGYRFSQLEEWVAQDLIHFPSNGGFPRRRDETPFDPKNRLVTVGDVWTDIDRLNQTARERLGYPTQKPLALLERIVNASSNPGDVVLDPFCGCGTAIHAAQSLGRSWIGIDVTHLAIQVIEGRLADYFPSLKYDVVGRPRDLASARDLADRDRHQFQWWAVWLAGGQPYAGKKKGADRGVDGLIYFPRDQKSTAMAIVSVKSGDNIKPGDVRDLTGTVHQEGADAGILVTLAEPTSAMRAAAASAGLFESVHGNRPRIQILTVDELLAGKRPNLPLIYSTAQVRQVARASQSRMPSAHKQGQQIPIIYTIPGKGGAAIPVAEAEVVKAPATSIAGAKARRRS